MENRQPTYPGRVILTPVPGMANTYDITRADEPTVDGTPLNKETLLQDTTCAILGISNTSVPNDAFVKLALGIGKYGYVVTLVYPDGSPAEGFTLTGLTAPNGENAVTNSDGQAVVVSTNQKVTIGFNSPYIDIKSESNIEIESTGILTDHTITLNPGQATILRSGVYNFSPIAKTADFCCVGGGGGGNCQSGQPGRGGGGGYVENLLNVSVQAHSSIKVEIGAGGTWKDYYDAGDGGKTTVSDAKTNEILVSANGGQGARTASGGTGNGNGSSSTYAGGISGYSPAAHAGGNSNIRKFNDPNEDLAGGGGGAAGVVINDSLSATRPSGGLPNGATGSFTQILGQSSNLKPAGNAIAPGGGGGGGVSTKSNYTPSSGASGGVHIRCYY